MAEEMSPEYKETLRRMSGEEKLRTASAIYWSARKIKAARLRSLHPEWVEDKIEEEVKRIFMHAVT